ncbi:MAG: hypothetical protein KF812_06950 [Fimbriimonadaceae bacterium]|nr:hypothetical protein [Fimbriimonadaceae bacterium]
MRKSRYSFLDGTERFPSDYEQAALLAVCDWLHGKSGVYYALRRIGQRAKFTGDEYRISLQELERQLDDDLLKDEENREFLELRFRRRMSRRHRRRSHLGR